MRGKEKDGKEKGHQRDDVEHQRMAHEGNVFFDAEEFHVVFSLFASRRRSVDARFPDLADRQVGQFFVVPVDEVD